jgi:uncharacterized protein YneF (UPF0154 family)
MINQGDKIMTIITVITLVVLVAIISFVCGLMYGAFYAGKMIRAGKINNVKYTG